MILLLAAALLDPGALQAAPTAAAYEVVRAGDREMACLQLIAEINAMNAQVQQNQMRQMSAMGASRQAMRGVSGAGAGVGGMLMGSVASMVPFGGYAVAAAQGARIGAAQRQMTDQIAAMQQQAAQITPVYQRLDHLRQLYDSKGC